MKKNEKNYGRLDFDEKSSKLEKREVLFDDSKVSTTDLSSNMLKAAFGPNFDTMSDENLTDFPDIKIKEPYDDYVFTGIMPGPF